MRDLPAEKYMRYKEIARRLCNHQPVSQIARCLDRTPTTIRKWMRDEQFLILLKETDAQVWAHVMEDLQEQASDSIFLKAEEDMGDAYQVIHDIMDDATTDKKLKHVCARDILTLGGAYKRAEAVAEKKPAMSTFHVNILAETIRQVSIPNAPDDGKASEPPAGDSQLAEGQKA